VFRSQRRGGHLRRLALVLLAGLSGCAATQVATAPADDAGSADAGAPDAGPPDAGPPDAGVDAGSSPIDAGVLDGGPDAGPAGTDAGSADAGVDGGSADCTGSGVTGACYAHACQMTPQTLQENRDRLIADLANRKCIDSCSLWASLNQAERYIFLMDTAYLGDPTSAVYPPGSNNTETALDHAVALYSINGPKAGQGVDLSGRGGQDYNRIYLGFDSLAECVMRNFTEANPNKAMGGNAWVTSDDLAGPHPPFTQREMIVWYRAITDLSSNGPQFHHWHQDSDFTQSGLNQRLGVCGVTDTSLVESTIAFDFFHNSDPLGDYAGRGGYGWQIVDQHDTVASGWDYMPTSCPMTMPVNTDPYGGGTYAGMGPSLVNGSCTSACP
jgi:hypothetical protein